MTINEKSAYIKGLAEGLNLDKTTPEGKLIDAMLDLISDMAEAICELDEDLADVEDYAEELDEDLGDLESYVYDIDDDCDCDCDDCDDDDCEYCDGDCLECDEIDCPDEDMRSAFCPSCGEQIYFDDTIDPESLICPACGKGFADSAEA